ncbi:transposase [Streptomyces sp. NPDC017964]|uniref:transposase n=1 Tax=Streptomyces sp. NPDC017964 TaxID=3365022 RepID=UPI0037939CFD
MQAAQTQRKFRGKNKAPKWKKPDDGHVSVMVLPLAITDPADLAGIKRLFGSMWSIKRAVQRDARAKVDAYWTAFHEREEHGAKVVRQRLGLNREALERCAYKHLDASGHLKHHVSKALAMHMAAEVWNGVQWHLFADATGKRHGRPKTGRWHDFTRIPGRARSHTTDRKWETFRLVGTLHGHKMAYTDGGQYTVQQPRRMRVPAAPSGPVLTGKTLASGKTGTRKATWWDHTGPLAVVFAGGPDSGRGDLVLPVRIPQQPGQWARVEHFLSNPGRWHKVDLVRRRKASAPGGWVYEAHLMILGPGYTAPAVRERREQAAALDRIGGVDGNVSNVSVASFPASLDPADGAPASTEITLSPEERALLEREAKKRRGRARALERSRRATNTAQYGPSKKQARRAEQRAAKGLKPKAVTVPGGARAARVDGVPKQAFRRDQLSVNYREQRARQAEHAASMAEHHRFRARQVVREIIAAHGPVLVVEDCDIRTWYRLWGKRLSPRPPPACSSPLLTANARLRAAVSYGPPPGQPPCPSTACAVSASRRPCGTASTSASSAASPGSATSYPPPWPHLSALPTWTTPRPRTWTPLRPGTHRSFSHKGWKKPCGSQPHRARPPFAVLVMRQSHGNAVRPLLPEPPDGGPERPWMSHAPCVTTPESPDSAPAATRSSPSGELRIKS